MNSLPGDKPPQFLSTHPNPENRERALAALGPEMEPYYAADVGRPKVEVAAERLWPGEDPIGRQIGFGRNRDSAAGDMEIVGVVETVTDDLFSLEPRPKCRPCIGATYLRL